MVHILSKTVSVMVLPDSEYCLSFFDHTKTGIVIKMEGKAGACIFTNRLLLAVLLGIMIQILQ